MRILRPALAALALVAFTVGAGTCGPPPTDTGIDQKAGAWWGDVSAPDVNQVWVEVYNATPAKDLTAPFEYRWACHLPAGTGQTETLDYTVLQVNSTDVHVISHPTPDTQYAYTLDPASFTGGDELRIRCVAHETVGPNTGQQTGVTAGFPVTMRGDSSGDVWQHHNLTSYADSHGWYSRGVEYDYAILDNAAALANAPVSGTINVEMHGFARFGNTVQDHHRVLIDGNQVAEFHGTTEARTVPVDTRILSNGPHVLAVHSHALEVAGLPDAQPGKQIAGQVEITITVAN